jgi:hypothetical protein
VTSTCERVFGRAPFCYLRDVRRAVWFVLAASVGAGGAGAACSSFAPEAGVAPEDARPDGATNADGETVPDGSTGDGGDAAIRSDADAGSGSPCGDPGHWLCDDFDRDGGLFPSWGPPQLAGDGGVSIEPFASAPSAPNVFTSRADGNEKAQLSTTRNGTAKGVRCELDLLVVQRGASQAILLVIGMANGPSYYRIEVRGGGQDQVIRYGAADPDGGGPIPIGPVGTDVVLGAAWHHFTIEVGWDAAHRTHVGLDHTTVVDVAPPPELGAAPAESQDVTVGVSSFAGAGGWLVRYDNVVCDPLP